MQKLSFDLSQKQGHFKIMNAINNGPVHKRHSREQFRSNLAAYKAARIPYARNHDAAHNSGFGGEHTVDITAIFPNFDADPYDPTSYDFTCTDEYILVILDAGTETFYRLGQKIEHYIKKFNIHPPKDFHKWAVICEHIIRHYNEGWANGFHHNIKYWEIWNEPDLHNDDAPVDQKTCWTGNRYQFFDLYEVAAKHLKKCFPHLKIGGPALGWNEEWAAEFLTEMHKREVPIDFFSWHVYRKDPKPIIEKSERIKKLLIDNGYETAESILNEWNYVKSWDTDITVSFKTIQSIKGAAFTMAMMTAAQHSTIDMLMYYNSIGMYNGLFDYLTLKPIKGYYPMYWYGMFYDMKAEVPCDTEIENIYTLCGCDENDKTMTVITYYTDEEEQAEDKTFTVDFGKSAEFEIYLLDETHDAELVDTTKDLSFTMKPNTCLMIKEK